MNVTVDHAARRVAIWLTGAEAADAPLRESVRRQCAHYRAKHYLLVEYCSGVRDLCAQTEGLLLHNRALAAHGDLEQSL